MNEEKLQEILARAEAATPGPWRYSRQRNVIDTAQRANDGELYDFYEISPFTTNCDYWPDEWVADATFIAAARTDVPALVAEIRRLRGELAATNRELERWRHGAPVEGDYVCPDSLEVERLRGEVERLTEQLDDCCEICQDRCTHRTHYVSDGPECEP